MSDRYDQTVIHTGAGAAGWFAAILMAVVLGFGAYFLLANESSTDPAETNVDVNVTTSEKPNAPAAPSYTGHAPAKSRQQSAGANSQ